MRFWIGVVVGVVVAAIAGYFLLLWTFRGMWR